MFVVKRGFTILEVMIALAIFLALAVGVYGGISLVFKIVYQSRMKILETALLAEELEAVRNLPFDQVGIAGGVPSGVLSRAKSVVRNGATFNLVTTVRNIDDPFDGTISGSPRDTAPADYKLVEISAVCATCNQTEPTILSTAVSPKNLEGATNNGALFVSVFDAYGLPVSGANVHIENNSRVPPVVVDDTTDADGILRLVDAPTGTLAYDITVSKSGYSFDYTSRPSPSNPNPIKPPSNVVSQSVTEISFSIDRTGTLNVSTLNQSCVPIGSVPFVVWGSKLVGTDPNVHKTYRSFTTPPGGVYTASDVEWDRYTIGITGSVYDVAGTAPMLPFDMTPGLSQDLFLILRPHSENSALVRVLDSGTKLPLSDATVRLYRTGYEQTLVTGVGYVRQTDWSGGKGQIEYTNETMYFNDNDTLSVNTPEGDVKLRRIGSRHLTSGWLESSTFDMGTGVNYRNLTFEPLVQPEGAELKFQLASSGSSTPASWNFTGPDGTAGSFYTSTDSLIFSGNNGHRYFRYRTFLSTVDDAVTPQLSEVWFTYTTSCAPPGQSFFPDLAAGSYNLQVSRTGYVPASATIEVSANSEITVELSTVE